MSYIAILHLQYISLVSYFGINSHTLIVMNYLELLFAIPLFS